MRSRLWASLLCLHCLSLAALAQSPAKRQVVLPVSNGGFVAFRSETSAPESTPPTDSKSLAALLYSQVIAGENRIIHRVLTDAERRVIFAYDLSINADPVTKKFSLSVLPAEEAFRRSFLKDFTPLRSNETFATFPKSTTPQTLDDGDAVSLELLVNHDSGVKIIDVVKVTFDRSSLRETVLEPAQKDFTLEAVSLAIKSYELAIDGNVVGKSKSKIGCSGSLLWFYVPGRGRFIFSLVPREGYSFEKIGILEGDRIEFTAGGERYEWFSGAPILPGDGSWNLWVLHDPNYTPLFAPEMSAPRQAPSRGPNVFQKFENVLTNQGVALTVGQVKTSGGDKPPVTAPQRVMIGGADSMENLLPKSPKPSP